jgi:Tfp pilus assembly protein PilE
MKRSSIASDESGLTLIELIVVVVLTGILSGVVVMILVNSWTTQKDVTTTSEATNEGQVLASSIERSVRNADAIAVTGDVLQVRSRIDGAETCWAFRFQPADGTPTVAPLVDDAAHMASGTAPLSWGGAWIAEKATPIGASYFTLDAGTLTYGFQLATDSAPVVFQGEITIRNDHTEGGSPCL